jgi:hypothetical protein
MTTIPGQLQLFDPEPPEPGSPMCEICGAYGALVYVDGRIVCLACRDELICGCQ